MHRLCVEGDDFKECTTTIVPYRGIAEGARIIWKQYAVRRIRLFLLTMCCLLPLVCVGWANLNEYLFDMGP